MVGDNDRDLFAVINVVHTLGNPLCGRKLCLFMAAHPLSVWMLCSGEFVLQRALVLKRR